MSRLSVDSIVNISVNMLPGITRSEVGCNIGLILGTTNIIAKATRMKHYSGLPAMIADGWATNAPEYVAAALYFKQSPAPNDGVFIGRIDSTSNPAETPAAALQACYDMDNTWYGVYACGASDAEKAALCATVEALGGCMLHFETGNSDALVENPETADIFTTLKTAHRTKAIGIYSTEDYAGAALLGLTHGLESGMDGSAFDLFFKSLSGVNPTREITESQLSILKAKGGNAFIIRGQDIKMIEPGNCVDGTPYDETMYIDLTVKTVQRYTLQAMAGNFTPKIAQTDDGMGIMVSAVVSACERMKRIGFVAGGKWTANDFGPIKTGDVLPSGYMVFNDSVDDMSAEDREARKLPNVYVAMKLSGSGRSISIGINLNR